MTFTATGTQRLEPGDLLMRAAVTGAATGSIIFALRLAEAGVACAIAAPEVIDVAPSTAGATGVALDTAAGAVRVLLMLMLKYEDTTGEGDMPARDAGQETDYGVS